METTELAVRTGGEQRVVDLTAQVQDALDGWEAGDGLLSVFVPHATAGLAVLETGAGSDEDLLRALAQVLPSAGPQERGWRHAHGSPGHGRDHVLPALVSPSLVVPVLRGRPALGTWQSVCLVDTNVDNADRRVRLSFLPG
ncbi:secondary thiamine-phosphate synthase enzyme YjbQ [Pseudokineococcus basanitobsidens]|uniref:Secondary thiamine-phosphate synthase enzyme YjbQ n=1 Tax=Pseudokineococcus basanitobsidens TaxID=1926649 RepID=A0ABU8RKR7_9ACTN